MMGNIQRKDKISNEKVLQVLKKSFLENIRKRKLKYFCHIKRKGNILTTARRGGYVAEEQEDARGLASSLISGRSLGCLDVNARGWLFNAICGVWSVKLRQPLSRR